MTWRWPSPKTLRRAAIGIVAALLVSLLLLRVLALTPMARGLVEARVEALTVRGQSIELEGFKGDLLGRMSVASLKVRDADGVWGEAENLDLSWGPLGLLSGHLRLKEVSSDVLTVSRRPILGPSKSGGSFLKRYTVQSLGVSTLSLHDGVAGPAQTYALTGRLKSGGQTGELALDLTPLQSLGDRIFAELGWGGSAPLTGQVDIQGAPGGLIASILQAPDDASITGSLDASGTFANWQLTATSAVAGTPILDLEARHQNAEYTAEGYLALAQLDRLTALRSRLGDRITFLGTLDAQHQLVGDVNAGTFSSSISGRVQTSLNGLTIEAFELAASDLDAAALTGQDGLELPQFSTAGTVSLSAGGRSFEGEVIVPFFTYDDYSVSGANARGTFAMTADDLSADAVLNAAQTQGIPARLQNILGRNTQLDLTARLDRASREISVDNFVLKSNRALANGAGRYLPGGAISMTGDLVLDRVAPVERFAGTWAIDGARISAASVRLDGALSVDQSIAALPDIIGADSQLSLTVQRMDRDLVLQSATLRSTAFDAAASGHLRQGQVAISGNLAAPALAVSGVNLNQLQAQFDLSGPIASPSLGLIASAADLQSRGRTVQRPQLSGDIGLTDDAAFSWLAKADYLGAPLSLELNGARRGDIIDLTGISADWADLQANGAAALNITNVRASEMDLSVTGSPPTLGEIAAQVSYRNEALDGDISLEAATFGPIMVDRSEMMLSGTWPQFTGNLTYDAELPLLGETRSISGTHGVTANAERRAVSLDGGFRLADQPFDFITPLNIELNSGLGITGQVSAYDGAIDFALKPLADAASSIILTDLALQKFGPLINRPALRGQMNGAADIALVDDLLTGQISATITDLTRGAPGAQSANLRLTAIVANDNLDAVLRTEDPEQSTTFTAQLSAPLTHNGQAFSIRPVPGAAIPVSIQGEGAVAPLWALAAPTDLRLEGDLAIDINNGPGTTWRFQGPVSLENGAFEDGITGLHLREIAIAAALRPDGIDVETARARGRSSGTIEASGLYGFDGNGSVALQLNRLNAFKRSDVSATVSGRAEIDRRNRRTQVSGDLDIDEARINLEKLPGAGYTTLDVVFTDELDAVETQAPEREAIALSLDVSAARRIFVTGSGVDTEWGLDLRITGSPGRPNFIGRANLVRGEADLLSRRFRFSEGRVRFIGAPMDTELTLRADRTSDDITSSITLSGSILDPEITLSADPSLPNDEILARVLFGRSPSELSPLQAAQLAGAAAQLAGGDALNLVGQLQQATGLDRLDFGLNDDGAATLSTGKYIAEDVYLEIETGGTGAPGVALEWTPLENVAIDAEIDPELGPKVAIQWKRDFDRLPGEPDSD